MPIRKPETRLPTHEVTNQPPPLGDYDAFETDRPLREAVGREGPDWVSAWSARLGKRVGSEAVRELGFLANRHPPVLKAFDAAGRRIDEVDYHPAYHDLMTMAFEHECHSIAWTRQGEGGAVAHVAGIYLLTQPEQGFCCPVTMTHAAVPALRQQPGIAAEWEPRILVPAYDPRSIPPGEKRGATFGMAMTEKQGGSDVRTNTTQARAIGAGGTAGEFELTGHKWFCSAPMSDAFLTLAQTAGGLTCFLVPRWRPDGTRNPFFIQRLKDKLGNRSNASGEIEYQGTWARQVGEEGRGVRAIIEMVHQTRLDAATAPAGMMRHALRHVLHHVRHRQAFGKALVDQPLMRGVLADLALDCEAATALVFRVGRAFDEGHAEAGARRFARLATAIVKFWINKRAPAFLYEAMECLGGVGYVEESVLPRLYREAPVNSIWEGSGNVICLDVLRAMQRDAECIDAFLAEVETAGGSDARLDDAVAELKRELGGAEVEEGQARSLVERMALALAGSLLVRHAPHRVADLFCASRLDGSGKIYGTLPARGDLSIVVERAFGAAP